MSHSRSHIIALMYHRVDVPDTDPWGICVSPGRFEEQVRFLTDHYRIISSEELVKQIKAGELPENSICITFDDGYADNCLQAMPVLLKYCCPATFFIATAFIGTAQPFWWDELEILFLHSKRLPRSLSLPIAGQKHQYILSDCELTGEQWQQHKSWKWYEPPPTQRCALFLDTWAKLSALPYQEIQKGMSVLRTWAGVELPAYNRLPMSKQQLQELSGNNLFSIGLHTHTHPDLSATPRPVQAAEITRCQSVLANEYYINSHCIAYPYGRYNDDTIDVVTELGLDAGFTTGMCGITSGSQPAKLGRYQVGDWDIDTFAEHLSTWSMATQDK